MAEVLSLPHPEQNYNSSLRRTSSQPSLYLDHQQQPSSSGPPKADYKSAYRLREVRNSSSQPSSAPSSPSLERIDFSNTASYLSTPSSSLSLDDGCDNVDEDSGFQFPIYHSSGPASAVDDDPLDPDETLPELSRHSAKSVSRDESPELETPPRKLSRTDSVTLTSIADDTAVKPQPTRHVDYLSHDWKEEEIWSSWRHIVAKRGELDNWERLENASWRTWMQAQQRLRTINPDKLNWMKDHDVTWLYGPLQTGSSHIKKEDTSGSSLFTRSDSFAASKKPILKRRSVSEIMLARSLSTQSLMRQATDAIKAQEAAASFVRPSMAARTYSDISSRPSPANSSNRTVPESPSPFTSSTSSGSETPDDGRHIHFNETVEQCIAITTDDHERDYESSVLEEEDEHSSDEEFLTMKTDRSIERKLSRNATPRGSFSEQGGKTIAMLPTTTLKYRADTPECTPQKSSAMHHSTGGLRESSSSETLRPSHPSANFLVAEDEDDEPMDPQWKKRPTPARKNSLGMHHSRFDGSGSPHPSQLGLDLYRDDNDELQRAGMRRTPSGMFMPYDENDSEMGPDGNGIYGKVVDTYNTARDIAHVIWNVGWRR